MYLTLIDKGRPRAQGWHSLGLYQICWQTMTVQLSFQIAAPFKTDSILSVRACAIIFVNQTGWRL